MNFVIVGLLVMLNHFLYLSIVSQKAGGIFNCFFHIKIDAVHTLSLLSRLNSLLKKYLAVYDNIHQQSAMNCLLGVNLNVN